MRFIKFLFLLIWTLKIFSQSKFETLLYDTSPGMPNTAFRLFVNTIEHNHHYYVFGVNSGYIPSQSGCNNTYDGWLVFKLDSTGNLIKSLRIGGPLIGERQSSPAIMTRDKGFLIPGWSSSFSVKSTCDSLHSNLNLIKLDSNLNFQWLKSYGGNKYELISKVFQLKNGQLMLFGVTSSFGHGGPYPLSFADLDIYILKLDSNGNLIKCLTYGTKGNDNGIINVIKDENDNFYCVGASYIDSISPQPYPFIMKIDSACNVIWSKFFYINYLACTHDGFIDIKLINNVLYVLHSFDSCTKGFCKILKIDKNNGNILNLNDKVFATNNVSYMDYFDRLIKLDTNRILVKFYKLNLYPYPTRSIRGRLIIDTNLNLINSAYYVSPFFESSIGGWYPSLDANHINLTSDNGIIGGINICLNTSPSTNNVADCRILFFKMDNNANTCEPDSGEIYIDSVPIIYTPVSGTITSVNQCTVRSWTPTLYFNAFDSVLCYCNITGNLSITPVSCYNNGSATFIASQSANYSYTWSPPINSSSNSASNIPAGNYTLTVSDSFGCTRIIPFTIPVNYSLNLSISGQNTVCSNQSDTLSISGAQSILWSTGQSDSVIIVQPLTSTTYTAFVSVGPCFDTLFFTVNVIPSPSLSISPTSYTILNGDTVSFTISGASDFSVFPNANTILSNNTLLCFPRTSSYYCVSTYSNNCYDSVCVSIKVDGSCLDFKIPNVFTPNNDNINDFWFIPFKCPELITNYSLTIFDRWGIKLFEITKLNAGWDGRTISGEPVPTGTYYYVTEFYINNKKQELKGYFTLLR
jgi:gliding motility-associated-like protein